MASPHSSSDNDVTDWNFQKWLKDIFNKETDDEIIQDANKSVDEGLSSMENNNSGIDNEFVNLSSNSKSENETTTDVSQIATKEPVTVQLLEANDQNGIVKENQDGEQMPTSSAELPAFIEELLENNKPSTSANKVSASGCRDSDKKAKKKSFPKPSEVCQPQADLPTFIEGLLENTACSPVKRKAECDGNGVSKKMGRKPMMENITAKQFPSKEEINKQKKKERERLRAKENRARKKQLDADNVARRLSLNKEVDVLKNENAQKQEAIENLQLGIASKDAEIINLKMKAERLQQEKDLEIVYLQKKVKRLEHEQEEKDAEIALLRNKLECRT